MSGGNVVFNIILKNMVSGESGTSVMGVGVDSKSWTVALTSFKG